MVDIPSYIRLVVDNGPKAVNRVRHTASKEPVAAQVRPAPAQSPSETKSSADVVYLVSCENRKAINSQLPTPEEAQEALQRLQQDLANTGQDVGSIHSNLDRRRILQLLAPLVES